MSEKEQPVSRDNIYNKYRVRVANSQSNDGRALGSDYVNNSSYAGRYADRVAPRPSELVDSFAGSYLAKGVQPGRSDYSIRSRMDSGLSERTKRFVSLGSSHLRPGKSAYSGSQLSGAKPRSAGYYAEEPQLSNDIGRLACMMADFQRENRLPKREPFKFSGSELEEYIPFIMEFDTMIGSSCSNEELLYSYLVSYTDGEAGDIVRSCFREDRVLAYRQAREALEKHYGNSYLLAYQFIDRLKDWPPIKRDHPEELRKFSLFLRRIKNMCQRSCHFDILNSGHELRSIADKLPYHMIPQWARRAHDITSRGAGVSFADLVDFVELEADIACQPYFGVSSRTTVASGNTGLSRKVLVTMVNEATDNNNSEFVAGNVQCKAKPTRSAGNSLENLRDEHLKPLPFQQNFIREPVRKRFRACWGCGIEGHRLDACQEFVTLKERDKVRYLYLRNLCIFCHGRHLMENCSQFKELSTSKRRRVAWNAYLCYACFRPGHRAPSCTKGQGDNSVMGIMKSEVQGYLVDGTRTASHVASVGKVGKLSPSVVVDIRGKDGTWVRTRAALDSHSSVSFVDRRLADRLQLGGVTCKLTLSTFSQSAELRESEAIRNISLRSVDGAQSNLNLAYSVNQWPFDRQDVPTPSLIKNSCVLAGRISDSREYPIEILIGMDEPHLVRAFESIDASRNGSLYVTRYKLGWAVCGNVAVKPTRQHCYRVKLEAGQETQRELKRIGRLHLHGCRFMEDTESRKMQLSGSGGSELGA